MPVCNYLSWMEDNKHSKLGRKLHFALKGGFWNLHWYPELVPRQQERRSPSENVYMDFMCN